MTYWILLAIVILAGCVMATWVELGRLRDHVHGLRRDRREKHE